MKEKLWFLWYMIKPVLLFITSPIWFPALIVLWFVGHCFVGLIIWIQIAYLKAKLAAASDEQTKDQYRREILSLEVDRNS